jgi:hypothetical protein
MKKNRPLFEMELPEGEEGVFAISIVDLPAIKENFVALRDVERKQYELAAVDEKKRLLVGAALIPDKQILRIDDETGEEFEIVFRKDVIEQAAHLYMKKGYQSSATEMHRKRVDGVTTVETWIVEDSKKDKSAVYGFNYKPGTWMVAMHVENAEVWSRVQNGELKGFSIEAFFSNKMIRQRTDNWLDLLDIIPDLLD